jgi:leader peptidase (prepilin peptidase)/N-methyltransferase
LLVGSFLNVVIHRLPAALDAEWRQQCHAFLAGPTETVTTPRPHVLRTLLWPPSHCPKCDKRIASWENIPVVSYLLLRGRCSHCAQPISRRYPLIESITALVSGIVAWHFGFTGQTAAALVLSWSLITLSVIDYDHQLLPDHITLPFLWLGLLLNSAGLFVDPVSSIIGAAAGYLILWSIYHAFRLLTGKEGMGYGDFKLLALLGAWLGWKALPVIVLLSSFVGAIVGLSLILLLGRDRNLPIPFGPYLAAAGWITLLCGEDLVRLYLNLAGLG